MSLDEAAALLVAHLEELLGDTSNDLLVGADAAFRVALNSSGQWTTGSGWLDAPDDHRPVALRTLAGAAVEFLRAATP